MLGQRGQGGDVCPSPSAPTSVGSHQSVQVCSVARPFRVPLGCLPRMPSGDSVVGHLAMRVRVPLSGSLVTAVPHLSSHTEDRPLLPLWSDYQAAMRE